MMTEVKSLSLKRRSCSCSWKTSRVTNGILFFVLVCSSVLRNAAKQTHSTFHIPDSNSEFQTHFLDAGTDSIYIGALNNIYKLSNELSLQSSMSTGPVQDNQLCKPEPFNCDHERTTTDHHSKVILVHQSRLITCGNVYQGTCDIRDPDSLNVTYGDSTREVVPNTPAGLAVAFIAESAGDEVLYVASSYGNWLRDEIPTVSTRLIGNTIGDSNLFKVSSYDAEIIIPAGTVASSPDNGRFNISYIHGFTSGQFSYFVAFQPSDHTTSSKYVSKLLRLCQGDPDFYSYIELPLICATNGDNNYNIVRAAYLATVSLGGNETKEVLVAAFTKSETGIIDTSTSESAVCIYPIEDINRAFYVRRINCAQRGSDNTEIKWLGSSPCRSTQKLVDAIEAAGPDGYCHIVDTMNPLGADNSVITISSTPVYASNFDITAVAAVQHFETSIIFVGDSDGRLTKLRVDDSVTAVEYENYRLHQTSVIRNGLLPSKDKEFVFVISENQITKIPVEECHEYTTCEECHAAKDPYCGWCSLQAQCTRRLDLECTGSENGTSSRWLSTDVDCLAITSVTPEYVRAKTATKLIVEIANLPPTSNACILRCVFKEGITVLGTQRSVVTSNMSKVKCYTPGNITATKEGSKKVELQIQYEENGQSQNIVATEFDFYDCAMFTSCSLCTGTKYGCHWCSNSNQCKDSAQSCKNSNVTSASGCPRILQTEEILVPAGLRKRIEIDGENFPSGTFSYTCRIDFDDRDQLIIHAKMVKSKIECDRTLFDYSTTEESQSGSLQVYWGDFALDMENNLNVTVYKCNQKAATVIGSFRQQTCAKCLSIDIRYQCRWCHDSNNCLPADTGTCLQNQLLTREMSCPNPTIISVSPISVHISGGTRLSIVGYNLGFVEEDVKIVTVAGVDCLSVEFVSSQRLYCTTTSVPNPISGKVIIQFSDSQIPAATSNDVFSYVVPEILFIFPTKGPKSGGTRLVVRGKHLDAGINRTIEINPNPCTSEAGYPCKIITGYNPQEIVCRTSSGNITYGRIAVTFDSGCETGGDPFSYRADPVINSFEKVTSIASGGLDLTISGDFFDIIQEVSMVFRIANETFQTKCSNRSTKMKLYCDSPNITPVSTSLPFFLPAKNISVYMDGVTMYMNLDSSLPQYFTFYNDPVYYQLPSGENIVKVYNDKQEYTDVIVQGDNLTLASSVEDVSVKIGTWDCLVFKLTNTEVACRPNLPNLPPGIYDFGVKLPTLIRHGNLRFNVGQIEYQKKLLSSSTPIIIIILSGVLFLILLVLVVILVCCCRKVYRRLKMETDLSLIWTKESKVKHRYFSKDCGGNTLQMSLQKNTDDLSEHIYFGDEMDYMTISSNRENNVMNESENTALEEDEVEGTTQQEGIVKEDGVTPETAVPLDMIEYNETISGNNENKGHYSKETVDDKASTDKKDQLEIASDKSGQESDAACGACLPDDTQDVSNETGTNPCSDRRYTENRYSDYSQTLPGQSLYSTQIFLTETKNQLNNESVK